MPLRILQTIRNYDSKISCALYRCYRDRLGWRWPLRILEYSGFGHMWIAPSIAAFICCRQWMSSQEEELLANFVVGLLMDLGWVSFLKPIVASRRPDWDDDLTQADDDLSALLGIQDTPEPTDTYSFPSGHATRVSFISFFAHFLANVSTPWAMALIYTWACLVSISRVLCGRHRLLEVVFGIVVGGVNYFYVQSVWLNWRSITASVAR